MRIITIFAFLICGISVSFAGEIILGVNGKTKHEIVIPDKFNNESAKESIARAAKLIQQAFAANRIKLKVVNESNKTGGMHGIYLGSTKFAKDNGVDIDSLKRWQHIHKAIGKNIIIAGNDKNDPVLKRFSPWDKTKSKKLSPRPYYVTLHSAAEFLYRYAGARFLKPDESGMEFMSLTVIRVPDKLDNKLEPLNREHKFSRECNSLFAIANHCGMFQSLWWGGGHQHWQAIIPEKHFKKHPEYFTLINGLRTVAGRRGHPCLSNPEVRELIYKHILAQCDNGYDIIQVGQNDGFTPCQCENCIAMYGIKPTTKPQDGIRWLNDPAWGEKIWRIHLELAKRLQKDRPGKKLMLTAYGPCLHPPTGVEFPENVMVEIACGILDSFQNWENVKVPGGFGALFYIWGNYQVPGYTPVRNISYIQKLGEYVTKFNVHVFDLDGRPTMEYGLEGPNIYAYLRFGMYPGLKSVNDLFNEYIESTFIESKVPMKRFFVELQKSTELWNINKKYILKMGRNPLRLLGIMYTPEIMNKLENDLSTAEKTATRKNVKKRLASVRLEFNFLKDIMNVIYRWHHFQLVGNTESFEELLNAVEKRNNNLKAAKLEKLKTNGRYMGIPPFNWNVAEMRKQGYSALKDKSTVALFAKVKPALDSKIWNSAKAVKLGQVVGNNNPLTSETTFKIMYDKQNLYIRVTGKQQAKLKEFKSRGRDGEIWLAESITFQISPDSDKSKYYYFSYDDVKNSFADAKHGFITDNLDPRYGWNDWHWNGDWSYETKINNNVWESMAVIPFKSINAKMPQPDDVWAFNIGRVHFLENGKREFSAWDKNVNKSYVPGDAFFGNLNFKKESE